MCCTSPLTENICFFVSALLKFMEIFFFFLSTRASLIKMFSPFGKIVSEDFLWHTRGPKRGEPRGFAFIQYSTKEVSCLLLIILFSSNS